MDFKGWVPTVSGRLSFSVVGDARYPTKSITSNVAGQNTRYIITYQKRNRLDAIVPNFFAATVFGLKGILWFLCIAKCSNDASNADDELSGKMYLFTKDLWRGRVEQIVKKAQDDLDDYCFSQHGKLSEFLDNRLKNIQEEVCLNSVFVVDFSLARTGTVSISVPEGIQSIVHSSAPTFPTNKDLRLERFHAVCSQLFFYLKDIAHTHQHHEPSTDTMIDLYAVDGDDFRWRCEVLRFLQRRILQFKRTPSQGTINASFGLLAYAKSFIAICKSDGHEIEPKWNYEFIKDSLTAAREKINTEIQDRIRKSDVFRNVVISILGIFLSYVSLIRVANIEIVKDPKEVSPFLEGSARILVQEPGFAASVFVLVILGSLMVTRIIDVRKINILRNIVRIFHYWKSYYLGIFFLFLAIVTAWLSSLLLQQNF